MNTLKGVVVKITDKKTAVVKVTRMISHPKYKKLMKKNNQFKVQTGKEVKVGETVAIKPCKRVSKEKYFEVV